MLMSFKFVFLVSKTECKYEINHNRRYKKSETRKCKSTLSCIELTLTKIIKPKEKFKRLNRI